MEAGLSNHVWTIEELVRLLETQGDAKKTNTGNFSGTKCFVLENALCASSRTARQERD